MMYSLWYPQKPYVFSGRSGSLTGVFPELLSRIFSSVCGTCAGSNTTLYFDRTKDGTYPFKRSEYDLKNSIGTHVHFAFPVGGKKEITTFQDHSFAQVVASPGSVYIVRKAKTGMEAIVKSILSCWPVFLIGMLLAMVFGTLLWASVSL